VASSQLSSPDSYILAHQTSQEVRRHGRGITGVHEWVFSETPTGVHVITQESFAGRSAEADVTGMQSALDGSLIAWLGHLNAAAESRA
jgi:hypothetical protein